jgi:hypothetical protein
MGDLDWRTIGIILGAALWLALHVRGILWTEPDIESELLVVTLLGAAVCEFIVGLVVVALGYGIWHWGLSNFLVSLGGVLLIMSVVVWGKNLVIKPPMFLWHVAKKQVADFRAKRLSYKEELHERIPIKRTVEELIEE